MMSYVDPDGVPPAVGAARVGAELRAARQRLGWNLPDISAGLRIRLPYLEAIEEGNLAALPGNAYAVGFVRMYASAIGLDPDEVGRRFRAEAQEVNRKTELTFPAPVPQRGVPAGAVVLMGILIAGGAYVGWYRYTGSTDGPAIEMERAAPPPDRLAAIVPQQAPSPQVASILPSSPPMTTSVPVAPPSVQLPVPVPVPVPIAPPAPVQTAPVTSRVMLHAKAGGWVQVREKAGPVLLNRVLRTGETWPVPLKPALLLTTSNAGGMELLVDGTPTAPLGAIGAMRRDVSLDPEVVKAAEAKPISPKPIVPKPAIGPAPAPSPTNLAH